MHHRPVPIVRLAAMIIALLAGWPAPGQAGTLADLEGLSVIVSWTQTTTGYN